MSNTTNTPPTIRWQLLSTVSALALLSSAYTTQAAGNDADRPLIWIELGGQMDSISGQGEVFTPAFLGRNPDSPVLGPVTPLQAQQPPKFGFGEDGKISFQPEGSDWVFAAELRYGRSSNSRHIDHQTNGIFYLTYKYGVPQSFNGGKQLDTAADFADTHAHRQESHSILDFSAGKDVGLGMFGKDASSVLSVGVRFAQFASKSTFDIRARPDLGFKYQTFAAYGYPGLALKLPHFHTYHATGQASRSFRGVGPSMSWSGSAPFVGNSQDGEITFDWGANVAFLFGKQKAHVRHQESGHYVSPAGRFYPSGRYHLVYQHPSAGYPTNGHDTLRSITVPNVGGSVGISFRKGDAKVSFGYRADFFFGAMDTGIDAAKKSNLTFNGPYASISVGLGD